MPVHPAAARLAIAIALVPTLASPAAAQADALPPCPAIFAHGGYPSGANAWERDQVRQPNNPTALQDYKNKGASGAEVDLQMTKNGTKAVMWHNTSTLRLTGSKADVNTLWWDAGSDKLNGRTIEVGPYKGERVHTFRQFLDAAKRIGIVPLVEVKGESKQSLLNSDTAIRNRAWDEVINPIRERIAAQEIMVYTHDSALRPELTTRLTNAGLAAVIANGPHRPVWPDAVDWEEPPPSWSGNQASWQAALAKSPQRMATSWPQQMRTWLNGRCTA